MQQSQPEELAGAVSLPQRQKQQPIRLSRLPGQMNGPPQPVTPTNNCCTSTQLICANFNVNYCLLVYVFTFSSALEDALQMKKLIKL